MSMFTNRCEVTTSVCAVGSYTSQHHRELSSEMYLIDLYNFKPPAELLVNREESQALRVQAAKESLVSSQHPKLPL